MKQKLAKLMYGRYGSDQYSRFLNIFAMLLLVVSLFLGQTARSFIMVVVLALLIYVWFRFFSKSIPARRQENTKYLTQKAKITDFFMLRHDMWQQRKEYRFFKCPSCKAVMRVPKGKGKMRIICKKCGTAFEKST